MNIQKNTGLRLLNCLLLAATLPVLPLSAAVLVTNDVNAPSPEEVLLSIAPGSASNAQWRNNSVNTSGRRDIGQTFQIPESELGSSLVTGFTFRVVGSDVTGGIGTAADGAAFSLSIYSFSSATSFTPDGPALYTSTGVLPGVINALDYMTFSLETPLALAENQFYGIVLTFTTMQANQSLNFLTSANTAYGSGTGVFYQIPNGGTELAYQSSGGDFQLSVLTTPVPEPGTVTLFGLAAATILFAVRKSRRQALQI